jgi:hypothetical protein
LETPEETKIVAFLSHNIVIKEESPGTNKVKIQAEGYRDSDHYTRIQDANRYHDQ